MITVAHSELPDVKYVFAIVPFGERTVMLKREDIY